MAVLTQLPPEARTALPPLSWRRYQRATLKDGTCRGWWASQCRRYLVEEHRARRSTYFVARVWVDSPIDHDGRFEQIAMSYARGLAVRHCENHRRDGHHD